MRQCSVPPPAAAVAEEALARAEELLAARARARLLAAGEQPRPRVAPAAVRLHAFWGDADLTPPMPAPEPLLSVCVPWARLGGVGRAGRRFALWSVSLLTPYRRGTRYRYKYLRTLPGAKATLLGRVAPPPRKIEALLPYFCC